jgi:hypothetical protein
MNIISSDYQRQIQELNSKKKFNSSLKKYSQVKQFVEKYKPKSILDYGCAHGDLITQLQLDFPDKIIHGFDPGVKKFEVIQEKLYDCIISNDVIEHIEPELLDLTFHYMESLFEKHAWFIIACYPAKKKLPDGRNAHLIIENPDWWIEKIKNTFTQCNIIYHETFEHAPSKREIHMILQK